MPWCPCQSAALRLSSWVYDRVDISLGIVMSHGVVLDGSVLQYSPAFYNGGWNLWVVCSQAPHSLCSALVPWEFNLSSSAALKTLSLELVLDAGSAHRGVLWFELDYALLQRGLEVVIDPSFMEASNISPANAGIAYMGVGFLIILLIVRVLGYFVNSPLEKFHKGVISHVVSILD